MWAPVSLPDNVKIQAQDEIGAGLFTQTSALLVFPSIESLFVDNSMSGPAQILRGLSEYSQFASRIDAKNECRR
jgi:hypothetical protein